MSALKITLDEETIAAISAQLEIESKARGVSLSIYNGERGHVHASSWRGLEFAGGSGRTIEEACVALDSAHEEKRAERIAELRRLEAEEASR